ncbi:transposase [Cereibacter sphaeroides]|uniref:transposase domain-containing protein n=1 Tax=Cereibacter sphaeroides TaxID=1063 RepID=UPI000F5212DE|nr:transposase domain-containing protein [Cereibacter sphaeroides]AZB57236.1 transposase [Cereibacter sphaeroides]AZB61520.1 transposase [Cereibacter sphaeroides]
MTLAPDKEWWTPQEIASARLPELPETTRGINKLATDKNWRSAPGAARRRSGQGGGWEYHWTLFPMRARRQLLLHAKGPDAPEPRMSRDDAWAGYEALPQKAKDKALAQLRIIQEVEAMAPAHGKDLAVFAVAKARGVGARTIWTWFERIEGVDPADRLPYLAPRHRAAAHRRHKADCDPEFFDFLKSDYLRLSHPHFASCYRRAVTLARQKGWQILTEKTALRRLNSKVSVQTQILMREGVEALKRRYPAQTRDKTALHALEAVNADFHKFDVFVRWPATGGEPSFIGRPQMVAFQDIFSGRILAWRVDQTPNSTAVLLAAGDMIEDWGIPGHVLLDNGREFAAKVVTGGAATRYRFKVKEDDVPGLFTALGCEIHWATPYSGQSKPIERAFRDMCDAIAKDPRFDGAWTGNRPEAKPEDYGSRAVDLEDFLRVLAEGIEEHNTRQGRRSEVAYGRSFADVFDESYASAPIRKATEAQRRLWLLGAEGLRLNSRTGEIAFQNNRYWAEWMQDFTGEKVVARFDPADLWAGLHLYSHDGSYLGHAPVMERSGFFDMGEARITARARRTWLKAEKEAAAAHRRYTAAELGRMLSEASPVEPPKPEAKVVRMVKPKTGKAASPAPAPAAPATVTAIPIRPVAEPEEAPRQRFKRALDLERVIESGGAVTPDQRRWLDGYRLSAEYRAEQMLWRDFGDTIFG